MNINITIDAPNATEARAAMAELLGTTIIFAQPDKTEVVPTTTAGQKLDAFIVEEASKNLDEILTSSAPVASAPTRERGKPSPGHARRTKAEIASDDAAAHAAVMNETAAEADAANAIAAISTGEERVRPEDTPEDAAQDAADEAAETAAAKTGLTLDDIRNVLGNYQKAYGLPATMEDGPKIIGECVPGAVKVSDVPEDKIAAVVEALKAAGRTNAFGRDVVTA